MCFAVSRLRRRINRNYFLEKNRADWQIARVNPLLNSITGLP
jgi:hypothetical protein